MHPDLERSSGEAAADRRPRGPSQGPWPAHARVWTPPATFDEYKLLRVIGRGGMGEVYLAHDNLLDRLVAVKFVGELEPGDDVREQLLTEARAAARLQHPNVLTIYRVGELEGRPFIISEFVRGRTLDTLPKPVPWTRALELGIGLARGLGAAHRRGVLHRDIKPNNAIITDDGDVKLLDFGLAKLVDRGGGRAELASSPAWLSIPAFLPAPVSRDAVTVEVAVPCAAVAPSGERPRCAPDVRGAAPKPACPPANQTLPSVMDAAAPAPRRSDEEAPPSSSKPVSLVRGTPHYMAPEIWRGEAATRRSDVYSLGVVLFDLCAGAPPHGGVRLEEVGRATLRRDAPPLRDLAPGVDPCFAAIVDRCLRRDPAERFASGEDLREALEQLVATTRKDAVPEGNPYRGLLPFDAAHRALFFGRANEIGTVLERLRTEPLVIVAGDSGVGKSSLCGAGVLPQVAAGALGGGRAFVSCPLTPGKRPVAALAAALAAALGTEEEALAARLRHRPATLGRELRRRLGDRRGLVIYVDQLEELVTIADPDEARTAAEALGQLAARVPGVRVLVTVRSDFLARVASLPGLGDEFTHGIYLLRPLSPAKIREAIVGPAQAKGVAFESVTLVEHLVTSTARPEGLPLLQFALAELWEARPAPSAAITADALAGIGGVAGALARHADLVLLALPADQRAAARRILTDLVTADGARALRPEAELTPDGAAASALEALVRGRLLVARDTELGTAYEMAHEALIKGWGTLRGWLDEQGGRRAVRQRLEAAAIEWERLGRTREALWSERQIAEAVVVQEHEIAPRERAFLDASRRAIRRNRLQRNGIWIGMPVIALLLYGAVRVHTERDLDGRVAEHVSEAIDVRTEAARKNAEVEALRGEAFAAFDAQRREAGEQAWARALALAADVERAYGQASQALESALALDGARADVRALLGDVLYERALAAERDRRFLTRDELLERLALYDTSGERRDRWSAPGRVTLSTTPAGARVGLARYEGGRDALALAPEQDLGTTPLSPREIAQGSYVLTLTAEGRAPVRYPLVVRRGETLRVALDLPAASDVPPGFVYVPAGRFLYGSGVDEVLRQGFLGAAPIHQIETGAFFIARRETTYAEWIEYLRTLGPEERASRAPRTDGGSGGDVALRDLGGGVWQLTLHTAAKSVTALTGEKIRYPSRERRAAQGWLALPVTGISASDALAYTQWLDATGRVPGARLCTEQEWERAARGADDREFPNGDRLAPEDANFDATYGKHPPSMGPDEVGSHPASRSPFGVDDMAGNAFEWVRASSRRESVLRGGSYFYAEVTCRSTNRNVVGSGYREPSLGLRVCASVKRR